MSAPYRFVVELARVTDVLRVDGDAKSDADFGLGRLHGRAARWILRRRADSAIATRRR